MSPVHNRCALDFVIDAISGKTARLACRFESLGNIAALADADFKAARYTRLALIFREQP
jgi:hypothetical protein